MRPNRRCDVGLQIADEVARDRVTLPRGEVHPDSEAQIDYGRLGIWLDHATAKRVAVWALVMVSVLFAASVRAAGDPDGPNYLVCMPCRRV
jgi:transposase